MDSQNIPIDRIFWYYVGHSIICSIYWALAIELFFPYNFTIDIIYKPLLVVFAASFLNVALITYMTIIYLGKKGAEKAKGRFLELVQMNVAILLCASHSFLIYIAYYINKLIIEVNFDIYTATYAIGTIPFLIKAIRKNNVEKKCEETK